MRRTTKAGLEEQMDESRWQAPQHQITIEVDTKRGVRRKSVAGVKSPSYFGGHVRGPLTDKKIARYVKEGFYSGERRRPML